MTNTPAKDRAEYHARWDVLFGPLTDEYQKYLDEQGIEAVGDAYEQLHGDDLTDDQRLWISDFILRWEDAEDAMDDQS